MGIRTIIEEAAVKMIAPDLVFPVEEVREVAEWLGEADSPVAQFIPSSGGLTAFDALVVAAYPTIQVDVIMPCVDRYSFSPCSQAE